MKPFQNATELRKKIEELRAERNRHHTKYLYGGSNVYQDAKKKADELDRQIKELQNKKSELDKSQLELI